MIAHKSARHHVQTSRYEFVEFTASFTVDTLNQADPCFEFGVDEVNDWLNDALDSAFTRDLADMHNVAETGSYIHQYQQ